ncbi:response regulator transcription factor [Ectothiorhodospira sp. BSL-9]|uniref:response regulator transcription factor n=1 Tax=Ectothiorhodospira sp. BSL-9 TaxID=1442136 RepID=UPI0012E85B89|nr:response regulator transcription factor [Ectothiorhodospira sp. BSL-9]
MELSKVLISDLYLEVAGGKCNVPTIRKFYQEVNSGVSLLPVEDYDSVTLISPVGHGTHFLTISSYLLCISLSQKINKINLIVTKEWDRFKSNPDISNKGMRDEFLSNIKQACEFYRIPVDFILGKVSFSVASQVCDISENLNHVVVKFKGANPLYSNFLMNKEIFCKRPVVTATFSSFVKSCSFSDIVLVRDKFLDSKQCRYFTTPTCMPAKRKLSNKDRINVLCSVYSGERIRESLNRLTPVEWRYFYEFIRNNDLSIYFVGLDSVDKTKDVFPDYFKSLLGTMIFLNGKMDLTALYESVDVFFTLPNAFGGGNGARQAINQGVLVLAIDDENSDISKLVRDGAIYSSFEELLKAIQDLLVGRSKFDAFLEKQIDYYNDSENIFYKSIVFEGIISESFSFFKERKSLI